MGLTKKILLVILLVCVFFSSLYFFLFRSILTAPIITQKNSQARKVMARALSVFEAETDRILTFTEDWAMWDSMYRFSSKPSPAFIRDLAPKKVLVDAELSLFLVVNKKKEFVVLEAYDNVKKEYLTFQRLAQKKGPLWRFLSQSFDLKNTSSAIVNSHYGPLLVVSSPILHSDDSGPQNGRVMMGRFVNTSFEQKISKAIGDNAFILLDSLEKVTGQPHTDDMLVQEDSEHMVIYYSVKDISFRHAFTIRVNARKDNFEILEKASRLFFILLIAGFLLLGFIIYLIINYLVVKRVKDISAETNNIFTFDDLSQRIPVSHHDEITLLSKNINKMLLRLQRENIQKEEVERMLALNEKLIFLGRVSAGITHEINNPLFAIANTIQLIKKQLPADNPKTNRIIQIMEKEIKRVRSITANMHKLSIRKIEKPVDSDLISIINAAINVVKWSSMLKYTSLNFKQQNHSFPLHGNPDTLEQVFLNIIINSIDAMEGKGELVININENNGEYLIHFFDTGPGFSDDIKHNLFAPFQTTKYGKGSGLGLHISNNIVINHGGKITLDKNYKNGAHLIVCIPKGGSSNESKSVAAAG